jgi:hypothetical protein
MTPPTITPPLGATAPGGYCAACGAPLAAGARFCHRCGTPAGQGAPQITPTIHHAPNPAATVLPWAVAFVALLALVAAFAAKNFGKAKGGEVDGSSNAIANSSIDGQGGPAGSGAAPPLNASGAPDISQMSPSERASRLYNRVMTYAENNKMDSARFFGANMAIPAHQMIDNPSNDERFHLGRLGEIVGDPKLAMAESDTILMKQPTSLLGLLLGARAARMTNDKATATKFDKKFLSVMQSELDKKLPDYEVHRAEIDRAAADARDSK